MPWRKAKNKASSPARDGDGRMPSGDVPVRLQVGDGEEHERILVPVTLFSEPRMVELLEMAELRYGYRQPCVLRIPCDARRFEQLMGLLACKAR